MEHQATFFDGDRAIPHEVRFHVTDGMLHVLNTTREMLAVWPVADVRAEALSAPEAAYRLHLDGTDNDARLIISAPDYEKTLGPLEPTPRRFFGIRLDTIRLGALAVSPTVALVLALIYGFATFSNMAVKFVPRSWEITLGQNFRQDLLANATACHAERVDRIMANLVSQLSLSTDLGFPVTITIIDDPMNNAFTLPGGQIVITRGLIDGMQGMDEFAGVLAHELGHVRERHGLQNLIAASGIQLLASTTAGSGDLVGEIGGTLTVLSHSREAEREADEYAATILRKSGIGTGGLVRWFERMQAENGGGDSAGGQLPALFSTHPPTEGRVDAFLQLDPDGTAKSAPDTRWPVIQAVCTDG